MAYVELRGIPHHVNSILATGFVNHLRSWRESLKKNEAMEKRKKKQGILLLENVFVNIHLGVVVLYINVRVTISII